MENELNESAVGANENSPQEVEPQSPDILEPTDGAEENTAPEGDELFVHKTLIVDPGQTSMRIDKYLAIHLPNITRSKIKNASLSGCLLVNGKTVKASYKVRPADEIYYLLPWPPPPDVTAEYVPLDIFYEDDNLLIVNKQPGLVVHPGISNWTGTMIHGLLWYLNGGPIDDMDEKDVKFPGLVHRIDKDTSGLLVIAKEEFTHDFISQQFFEHSTERHYYAMVWGDVKEDKGTVIGHVGRSGKNRKLYTVHEDGLTGKHAVTHYEVLERFGFLTLIKCQLETGRTHQIRVHMKYLGHTLFSDSNYGGDKILSGMKDRKSFREFIEQLMTVMPRQSLHAKSLGFVHPSSNERIYFESELPADFQGMLKMLRENAGKFN